MGLGRSENLGHDNKSRILLFGALVLCIFIFILAKLFSLQIINQMTYSRRAREVAQRSSIILSQRGKIFDRHEDFSLVDNVDSFRLMITPANTEPAGPQEVLTRVSEEIGTSFNEDALGKIPGNWQEYYQPVEIATGIPFDSIVPLAEKIENYPGVYWESSPLRYYNQAGSINHVLGYVGRITLEEWQVLYNQGYEKDSILGKSGVEKIYDSLLKGENGLSLSTVDVKGRNVQDADMIPPENGYDLVLTLDRHVQILAEKALGERKGSVIVLKPTTGEILAMVSYPNYNPNLFSQEGDSSFKELSLNRDFPFLNRSIQSSYAPASTFKVVMTFALLAEGYNPELEIYCSGSMMLGDREFHCHKKTGHGSLNLNEALAESCNIYFGTAGVETLGIQNISRYARMLGLGTTSNLEIPGEVPGTIPDPQWKEDVYHTPWTGGDTLNASIGQGFLAVTPLQMANMMAMLVNGGVMYKPHILKRVVDNANGTVVMEQGREVLRDIRSEVEPEVFTTTLEAMREVITSGTAQVAIQNNVVEIAGKTGTGEVGLEENFHAWFVSYGPYRAENPDDQVVVITQVEAYNENWDWWAIKAADMIYQGIFGNQSYEEVVQSMKDRWVWYVRELEVE